MSFVLVHVYRWEELNSLADQRRRLLAGAEQVHKFVRDAAETNDRMNEKVLTIAVASGPAGPVLARPVFTFTFKIVETCITLCLAIANLAQQAASTASELHVYIRTCMLV